MILIISWGIYINIYDTYQYNRPFGFGNEGVWKPVGINECIRFTRYSIDGHFKPHRDGSFVWNDEERSIFTVYPLLSIHLPIHPSIQLSIHPSSSIHPTISVSLSLVILLGPSIFELHYERTRRRNTLL